MAKKPDPWRSYVEPDWKKASAADVAVSAARNFLPSAGHDLKEMGAPFLPQNWGKDVEAAKQIATGLGSKAAGFVQKQDPTKKAKDEAAVSGIADFYKQRYGTGEGFKRAVGTDPFGVLLDASSVLSIPAGGEGIAARVPGVAGKAAQIATRAARVGAEATNPLVVGAKAIAAPAKIARRVIQGPILDKTGSLSTAAKAAVSTAFPSGIVSDAELANPVFKAAVVKAMQAKGITPEAVKQAVLDYHQAPAPRSAVSSHAPPRAAAETAQHLADTAQQKLGTAAKGLTGGPASPSDLGAALERAQIAGKNNYVSAYNTAFGHDGSFAPTFADDLEKSLSASLAKDKLPVTGAAMAKYPSSAYPQAKEAFDWLTSHVKDLANNGELTLPNLERARQALGTLRGAARGTDSRAVGAIIDGLDQHVEAMAPTMFMDATGAPTNGAALAADIKGARQAFRDYQQTFHNTDNPTHAAVAQAVKFLEKDQAIDPATGLVTAPAPEGSAAAAQGILAPKLVNTKTLAVPPAAEKLHGKLAGLMQPGDEDVLNDFVRQTALSTDDDGKLLAKPDALVKFLGTPLGQKALTPEEMSNARLLSAGSDVLASRPKPRGVGLAGATAPLVSGAVGYGVSKALGLPGELGMAGGVGGEKAGAVVKGILERRAERSGAPANLMPLRAVEGAGQGLESVGSVAPAESQLSRDKTEGVPVPTPANDVWAPYVDAEPAPQAKPAAASPKAANDDEWSAYLEPDDQAAAAGQAAGGRIERASGGRVDGDRLNELVEALVNKAKAAKTAQKAETKPLLNTPDDAVAKALAVAQAAI